MSTFDEREQGFERKYVLDEELAFKTTARRNKLLGLWAAEKMGKNAADADRYAQDIVMISVEGKRHGKMIEKLIRDLNAAGHKVVEKDIQAEMERLLPIARQQIIGPKN